MKRAVVITLLLWDVRGAHCTSAKQQTLGMTDGAVVASRTMLRPSRNSRHRTWQRGSVAALGRGSVGETQRGSNPRDSKTGRHQWNLRGASLPLQCVISHVAITVFLVHCLALWHAAQQATKWSAADMK
ncbi:hypothetical protein V8C86DRAFT_1237807 [Haematococcus lacustris]